MSSVAVRSKKAIARGGRLEVAGWTPGCMAGAAIVIVGGFKPQTVPHEKAIALLVLAFALSRLIMHRPNLPPVAVTLVMLSCVAVLAMLAAPVIATPTAQKLFGAAVAFGLGALLRRRPEPAVIGMFVLPSTYMSLQAILHFNPYNLHDALLAGFCVAVLLGYLSGNRDRRAVPIGGAALFALFVAVTGLYAVFASVPLIGSRSFYVFG